MDSRGIYIEESIINALTRLLCEDVNTLLEAAEHPIPPLECTATAQNGSYAVQPVIQLTGAELSEKDRIIQAEAYTVTITLAIPEGEEAEFSAYAYMAAMSRGVKENPTLYETVSRAVITRKQYTPPKHRGSGESWELAVTLRLSTEAL